LSVDSGRLKVVSTDFYNGVYQDIATTVGRIYSFTRTVEGGTGTLRFRTFAGPIGGLIDLGGISTIDNGAGSTETFIFVATSTTTRIHLQSWNTIANFWLDNISVKEVTYNSSAADATLQLTYHPNDVPRIEYDLDGTAKGLLVEEARTNLVTYSEDFSTWTAFNSDNFTVNYAQAPDGTQTATRFNPEFATDPGISAATLRIYRSINSTAGDVVTFSLFVKPVQSSSLYVNNPDGSDVDKDLMVALHADQSSGHSSWNFKTKTWDVIDSDHAAFQEAYPDGWYRIGITYTVANNDSGNYHFISFANRGNAVSFDPYPSGEEDAYIWGAQVEEASFPTSYIKTTGATATRSADVASIPVADFGFHPNSKGTLFVEVKTPEVDQIIAGVAFFNSTSYQNSAGFSKVNAGNTTAGGRYLFTAFDGDSTNLNVADANTGNFVKLAGVFGDGMLAVADGGAVLSGTERTLVPTHLRIGGRDNGRQSRCHIKSIKYYPRRLTDAQLQELTT